MKNKFILLIGALTAFILNLDAQPSAEDMAKHQTDMMSKELNLTEDQEEAVYAINLKYAEKIGEIMQQHQPGEEPSEGSNNEMEEIEEDMRAEFEEILTVEQLASYDELVEERHNNRPGPGGPGGPGGLGGQ